MKNYLKLLEDIIRDGCQREDRTGVGTLSLFGYQTRYSLRESFPACTTKKLHMRSIIYELLWFLKGDTNVDYLQKNGVSIWNEWADSKGELGPIYGKQWRCWEGADGTFTDQMAELIEEIKNNPTSRRLIVSAWNVADLKKMALPPCHTFMQFYVNDRELSCHLYQRSADVFLGVPFNIASYSLLTMMIAQVCDLRPGDFIHTLGDAHLYSNHLKQAQEQLKRAVRSLPKMHLNPKRRFLDDFQFEDFELIDYNPHPHIKAEVAV